MTHTVKSVGHIGWPAFTLPPFTSREAAEMVAEQINAHTEATAEVVDS